MDKEAKQSVMQMAYASSIGIAMAVAIFGCFFLGNWLDSKLGTEPYFTLGLLIIGIIAGFRNMYVLIKRYVKSTKPTMQEESERHGKRPPPTET